MSAWQRKIETIGNLNYPDFIDSSSSSKLTLSVTIGKDGDLLDYALIKWFLKQVHQTYYL